MKNIAGFCSCPLQLVAATIRVKQRHRFSRFTSTITLEFDSTQRRSRSLSSLPKLSWRKTHANAVG